MWRLIARSRISRGCSDKKIAFILKFRFMSDQTLSEKLAYHCAALRYDQIPSDVIEAAGLHILDSLGCLVAGARLEPGRLAYDLAGATSGGGAASTLL